MIIFYLSFYHRIIPNYMVCLLFHLIFEFTILNIQYRLSILLLPPVYIPFPFKKGAFLFDSLCMIHSITFFIKVSFLKEQQYCKLDMIRIKMYQHFLKTGHFLRRISRYIIWHVSSPPICLIFTVTHQICLASSSHLPSKAAFWTRSKFREHLYLSQGFIL